MKSTIAIIMFFSNFAIASPNAEDVVISVQDISVPERVERGSDVRMVLSGMFPNACYRWHQVEIKNRNATSHYIRAHAVVFRIDCMMMTTPFSEEVNLGPLQPGVHTLHFVNDYQVYSERSVEVN